MAFVGIHRQIIEYGDLTCQYLPPFKSNMLKKTCEKFRGDNNDLEWVGQYQQ
tara:strand:- start:16 stop:171 length:156 start_codon:yes stop_codon:yes gene_type:complete